MEHDFFSNLPSEIITDILSRLSVRTIATSKCVCKQWLHLLATNHFTYSHLSKSVPTLAVLVSNRASTLCTIYEFEDESDLESHNRRYNPLINFDFPNTVAIEGTAANDLLLLHSNPETLFVCNPSTRDYIVLYGPDEFVFIHPYITYGFGESRMSGQYKVVRIVPGSDCHVYTLGTGAWRRVALLDYPFYNEGVYGCCSFAAFVNGNLNWAVSYDLDSTEWCICCFDVETECFSTFSGPYAKYGDLSVLRGCLCFCDITLDDKIVLWMMEEYGVERSWRKEYVMGINPGFDKRDYPLVYPIKVFKNGDVLMLWNEKQVFYYSEKSKATREVGFFDVLELDLDTNAMLLTPNLFSLKSFAMEDVISF